MSKTRSLHVHHAFLYISLPSLHNDDVKWPNFKLLENGNGKPINSTISVWTWARCPFISSNLNSLLFESLGDLGWSQKKEKGCKVYFSGTFSLTSPLSDRKVPKGVMFYGTTLQCWNNVVTIQNNVATMLQIVPCNITLIADRRVSSNDSRNNCGTHFGFRSLLMSKVANVKFFSWKLGG